MRRRRVDDTRGRGLVWAIRGGAGFHGATSGGAARGAGGPRWMLTPRKGCVFVDIVRAPLDKRAPFVDAVAR